MAKKEKTYSELQSEIERLIEAQKDLKQKKAEIFTSEIMKTDLGKKMLDMPEATIRALARDLSKKYTS